jgi:UDP-N-acetylglucosamine transferase subunit ALG13
LNKPFIFVTTGTQLPFDRLIGLVDKWAELNKDVDIVAQTANSDVKYYNIKCVDFLSPQEYESNVNLADVIIGHAGMGTIITGIEKSKVTILMARKFEYGEHRNDHQIATAEKFKDTKGIYVAESEADLIRLLNSRNELPKTECEDVKNRSMLINFLSDEIGRG